MTHQLLVITKKKTIDITPIVNQISWRSSKVELTQQLDFNVFYNDAKYTPIIEFAEGDMVVLKNEFEIFRGIIVNSKKSGRGGIPYTALDYSFYLGKTKKFYQFNKMRADLTIKKIVTEYGLSIGSIVLMPTLITKVYVSNTGIDMIKEIVDFVEKDQGIKYCVEMREGKFYIDKKKNLYINAMFKLADNVEAYPVSKAISSPTHSYSIENMKNSVQIVKDNKVIHTLRDDELIKKYGLLQDVVEVTDDNIAAARTTAKNTLSDYGKVIEESSQVLMGDDRVRAGRIIYLNEPLSDIQGNYEVSSVTHTVANGIHTMNVELEV